MNWLDITLIVIASITFISLLVALIWSVVEQEIGTGITIFGMGLFIVFSFGIAPFWILDKASGSTIGQITSVDKNFFGTTAIYIKTSETEQEKYCIENKKLVKKASNLIGKEVKIEYGTRVGLYSTGKCNQAPIKTIEEVSNE